jgi:hypothetical protein
MAGRTRKSPALAGLFDSSQSASKKSGEKMPSVAWIIFLIPLKSHLPTSGASLHRLWKKSGRSSRFFPAAGPGKRSLVTKLRNTGL